MQPTCFLAANNLLSYAVCYGQGINIVKSAPDNGSCALLWRPHLNMCIDQEGISGSKA